MALGAVDPKCTSGLPPGRVGSLSLMRCGLCATPELMVGLSDTDATALDCDSAPKPFPNENRLVQVRASPLCTECVLVPSNALSFFYTWPYQASDRLSRLHGHGPATCGCVIGDDIIASAASEISQSASNVFVDAQNKMRSHNCLLQIAVNAIVGTGAMQGQFFLFGSGGTEENATECLVHLLAHMPRRDLLLLFSQPYRSVDFLIETVCLTASFKLICLLDSTLFIESPVKPHFLSDTTSPKVCFLFLWVRRSIPTFLPYDMKTCLKTCCEYNAHVPP